MKPFRFAILLPALFLSVVPGFGREIPAILQNHKDRGEFTRLDEKNNRTIPLFNGKNLRGWYTYTDVYGKNNDVEKAFTVKDGLIRIAGPTMGYICTEKPYKNYYLKIVFRWGEEKYAPRLDRPRDSGVLYHFPTDVPDHVWPLSIECQIQEGDCGDYWYVGGATAESPNPLVTKRRILRTANFENPTPEWNTIEVICVDDRSEHYVNGHLVNEAYRMSLSEGKILFQLEGAEVYYKTIELLPLK